jgi:ribonuclease D
VDDAKGLEPVVNACRLTDVIALDTEFERSTTYFARPALLQLRIDDQTWLIDPIAVSTLEHLGAALNEADSIKIMHSASEDLAVLELATGQPVHGLFDTQLAAAFAGHGFGLGYHALANRLLGVTVNKDQTRSNWLQRPLTPAQLAYAAADVEFLPTMHEQLRDEVHELGRSEWLAEETQALITRANSTDIERDFLRLASRVDSDEARGRLRELCQQRESLARQLDRPRKHVADDPILVDMARGCPQSRSELENLPSWRTHRGRVGTRALLDAVQQSMTAAACELPAECQDLTAYKQMLNKLKQVVANVARSLTLEPAMLAPRRVLEKVVVHTAVLQRPGLPAELDGWRGTVLNGPLLECLQDA